MLTSLAVTEGFATFSDLFMALAVNEKQKKNRILPYIYNSTKLDVLDKANCHDNCLWLSTLGSTFEPWCATCICMLYYQSPLRSTTGC